MVILSSSCWGGDTSVIVVKKLKDCWDECSDLSCEGVAKGCEIFSVDGLNNLLDEDSFEK